MDNNVKFHVNKENLGSGFVVGNNLSNTLQVDRCDRIIFRDRTLDFVFEIGHDQYKDIDTIIVNGIKFKREV